MSSFNRQLEDVLEFKSFRLSPDAVVFWATAALSLAICFVPG
jgi:hypothetical protein